MRHDGTDDTGWAYLCMKPGALGALAFRAAMAGRTPALTWRMLAALRATPASSSEPAAPFRVYLSTATAPCATSCVMPSSFIFLSENSHNLTLG